MVLGIQAANRWTYLHHLRLIKSRMDEFVVEMPEAVDAKNEIDALLEEKPDSEPFLQRPLTRASVGR